MHSKGGLGGIVRLAMVVSAAVLVGVSCVTGPDNTAVGLGEGGPREVWRVSSQEKVYPDGIVSAKISYGYDATGTLLSETQTGPAGALVSKRDYSARPDGSVEIVTTGEKGEILGKAVRTFASGRLASEILYGPTGTVQSTEEYRYDGTGKKTSRSVTSASGFATKSEYAYQGNEMVQSSVMTPAGKVLRTFKFSYQRGMPILEEEFDGSGNRISRVSRAYDKSLLVREERTGQTGGATAYEYSYDAHGNPVEIRFLDRDGTLVEKTRLTWVSFPAGTAPAPSSK